MHLRLCSISDLGANRSGWRIAKVSVGAIGMIAPFQHLRFSIRQLRKSPGFALTAILTLALGIGAAASIFSVVDAVLLKPFAFRDPGSLVVMREVSNRTTGKVMPDNYRHYLRLKSDSRTLEDAAIFENRGASVSPDGKYPHVVGAITTSPNLFRVLGVQPILGRDFLPKDAVKGADDVVILSYEGWKRIANDNPSVIGSTIRIDGAPNTVIGVLPQGVKVPDIAYTSTIPSGSAAGPREALIFKPLVPAQRDLKEDIGGYNYKVIARLKPGVTLAQSRAELQSLQQAYTLSAHLPEPIGISLTPLAGDVTSGISEELWLLFAAIGAVLLIACVNLANLQLARAVAAEHETAVRAALGAGKAQLLLSRWMESLVLAIVGGIAGIALAFLGVRLLLLAAPANIPRLNQVQVNLPVLFFAAGVSMLSAMLFGILPALRAVRVHPQAALQSQSSRISATREGKRIRSTLVAAEIACTLVLLIVTALVLRSFSELLHQNRGFDSGHVTLAEVDLFAPQYGDSQPTSASAKVAFIDRALNALRQLPGVTAAGMTSAAPLTGESWIDDVQDPSHPLPKPERPLVNLRFITPGYRAAIGTSLISGRDLDAADRSNPYVALISEKVAQEVFPGQNPIGRKIDGLNPLGDQPLTVIGVLADSHINGLKNTAAMAYIPYWVFAPWTPTFVIRSTQNSAALGPEIRRALWNIDPQIAIPEIKSLDDQLSESVATDRFQTILLSGFGAAALLLALLGIYGVLAYSVSLRQQEFGIRIALGSDKTRLITLVLRQAAWPVACGAGAGLIMAFAATRWMRSLLYQTRLDDPLAIGGSLIALIGVAVFAAVLPARRAAQINPVETLRNE